jgi:iron-sulfur cluster repair protein YtfE (RIC family)
MKSSTSQPGQHKQRARSGPGGTDAISLLMADHERVKSLFEQYEQLSDGAVATKRKLAAEIGMEIDQHSTIEEEIFYPAVRAANKKNGDMVDEALVEHAAAKDLVAQIQVMDVKEDLFDAKVKVLYEQILHHIEEEERDIFPAAQSGAIDLDDIGERIRMRKEDLQN